MLPKPKIVRPMEIPVYEKWLLNNKKALRKVTQGLKDAVTGRLSYRGSFSKFADDDSK